MGGHSTAFDAAMVGFSLHFNHVRFLSMVLYAFHVVTPINPIWVVLV
jgi:hypothetical protein